MAEQPAAIDAKGSAGPSRARRKQVRDRLILGVVGLLGVAAAIAFLQSRTDTGPPPTPPNAAQLAAALETPPSEGLKKGGTLGPAARQVAARFLLTAVSRTELAEAWNLVTPEFRAGVTRAQWLRGELPVPPFPVTDLETTGFQVLESNKNRILIQVLLVPKPGTEYVPTRYDLTVERVSAKAPWKISYAAPYAPPGRYAPTE